MNYTPPAQQGQAPQVHDPMAAYLFKNKGQFRWINHTFSHFNLLILGPAYGAEYSGWVPLKAGYTLKVPLTSSN